MSRRRSRADFRSELPIQVSRGVSFDESVQAAFALLPIPKSEALTRLCVIARAYHDGRRMQEERVSRADCRKSLELLSEQASKVAEIVVRQLCQPLRRDLARMVKSDLLPNGDDALLPSQIGDALNEVADIDLSRWVQDFGTMGTFAHFEGSLRKLAQQCSNLPQHGEWLLIELQQYVSLMPPKDGEAEFFGGLVGTLGKVAGAAAQLMSSERGPRSDTVQMRAVEALKAEYEQAGGQTSHNAKNDEGYTGEANSPFGKFVYRFFEGVDPVDRQRRGLDDAIAFACWHSRRRRRRSAVERDTKRRQDRILEILTAYGVTNFSALSAHWLRLSVPPLTG